MTKKTGKLLATIVLSFILFRAGKEVYAQKSISVYAKSSTTYYVDAHSGNDHDPGTSPKTAWKTLDRVNKEIFQPGDSILFDSGMVYVGQLAPEGSGSPGKSIVISKYADGNKPHIEGRGKFPETVLLSNVEYWDVRDLEISNKGEERVARRAGVRLVVSDFGTAHHIHLQDLYVHDVNGSNVKSKGGGAGITWNCRGDSIKSRFDDLLIANCHLVRTDRNGITGSSSFWPRYKWFPSLHVVIRNNLLEDIGGDGIVPIACDSAVVEYNVIHGGRQRARDYAAGIWPWSCDNTVIQYNEVSGMKGYRDGQGYDSDWNCRNTLIQYNYSHDNDGGFLLICNNGHSPDSVSVGNVGTIVRYNISQNDGSRTFQMAGPVNMTAIYNNTIFVGDSLDVHLFLFNDWFGWSVNTHVFNNIFYSKGIGRFSHQSAPRLDNGKYVAKPGYGKSVGNVFDHNVYFGHISNHPSDPDAVFTDPKLMNPGSGRNGRSSLDGYRLSPKSPIIKIGRMMPENGTYDFFGNRLPHNSNPDIGAYQSGGY